MKRKSHTYNQKNKNDTANDLYQVEKIIGKRKINNIIQYKTKWKDYSLSQSTWEPKEHFKDCLYFINNYEKKLLKKAKAKGKTKEKERAIEEKHLINPNDVMNNRIDLTLLSESNTSTTEEIKINHLSSDYDFLSIETVSQKNDEVYAYVKSKSGDEEVVTKVNTKVFYTFRPELLIQYYESKLTIGK